MSNVQLRPRQKNNDQIRIRNRGYKIKKLIAHPKNVEVKEKWCSGKTNGSQKKSNLSQRKTKTRVLNFPIAHH